VKKEKETASDDENDDNHEKDKKEDEDKQHLMEDLNKSSVIIDAEIDNVNARGTLKDFASPFMMLNSMFKIAPTIFFLYAIFKLICYILVV